MASEGKLIVTHNAGLTSCMSVRMHEVCRYRERMNAWPHKVDSSKQFQQYMIASEDVSSQLLEEIIPLQEDEPLEFIHDWQFSWYHSLPLDRLRRVAWHYCWPSSEVIERANRMIDRMDGRTGVLYRGNDKQKEIPRTPYDVMFQMAEQAGGPFWVQTDEEDFLRAFCKRFPAEHLEFLPRIPHNPNSYVIPQRAERTDFAMNFLAALYALAKAPKLITTTGNTALWAVIFRGHSMGLWQYFSREGKFWPPTTTLAA